MVSGAVLVPGPAPVQAATNANLVVGFVESDPANHSGLVLNGWGFKRFGLYGVTVDGTSRQAVSIAVSPSDRHRRPGADELEQLPNLYASPLLDYLLWAFGDTTDPVTAAALHVVAWHLTGRQVGNPKIGVSGPTTAGWGPAGNLNPGFVFYTAPTDATGAPPVADAVTLGDMIENTARAMVTSFTDVLGPWSLDLSVGWGPKQGTVTLRSGNGSPIGGVTIQLLSPDSTVPATVVTDPSGSATFSFAPFADQATVTATVVGPGVHTEHDVVGDSVSGGFQRSAVGRSQTLSRTATVLQPIITSYAKDAVDGDKVVGAGGTIVDTLQYQNLVPGQTYTTRVMWYYQDTSTASSLAANKTFVAGPTGAGTVDVGPFTTGAAEIGRSLVAYQFLYVGPTTTGVPEIVEANLANADQTVTVESLQLLSAARDVSDGDNTAYPGATISDTLAYIGLAPGQKYTVVADWHLTDGFNSLGPTGLSISASFFADPLGFGTVDIGTVTLTGGLSGVKLVAFERVYVGDTTTGLPLATHQVPGDPNGTITVPYPTILTVAQDTADGDKNVTALGLVQDQLVFAGLHPGVMHTAQLEFRFTDGALDLGPTGVTTTRTFIPTTATGGVVVGPVRLNAATSGRRIVAYQRVYLGPTATGLPIAVHEIPFEPAQTLFVGEQQIFAQLTQGTSGGAAIPGDKEVAIGTGATIVNTITVNLPPGTLVTVTGHLVRYDAGECTDPLTSVIASLVVSPGQTLSVVHTVPEAPGDYVGFVILRDAGGNELFQNQDCQGADQRVSVVLGDDDLPETR